MSAPPNRCKKSCCSVFIQLRLQTLHPSAPRTSPASNLLARLRESQPQSSLRHWSSRWMERLGAGPNRAIDRGQGMPKAMPQEAQNERKCKRVLPTRDATGGSAAREKGFAILKGNQLVTRSRVEKFLRSTTRMAHAVSLARRQHGCTRTESVKWYHQLQLYPHTSAHDSTIPSCFAGAWASLRHTETRKVTKYVSNLADN